MDRGLKLFTDSFLLPVPPSVIDLTETLICLMVYVCKTGQLAGYKFLVYACSLFYLLWLPVTAKFLFCYFLFTYMNIVDVVVKYILLFIVFSIVYVVDI